MMYRRQKQQYLIAGLLAVIAVVNVLFYFILHRPARTEYARLQVAIESARNEAATRQQAIFGMERTSSQLERFEQDKLQLFRLHFTQRDAGFAAIMPQLDAMAARAGVRKTVVQYAPEPLPQYGLESVKINIPVQGTYASVVDFIRELETSQTLYLINAIDVRSAADSGDDAPGNLALTLALETYFYR